jgi:hypothetical protein
MEASPTPQNLFAAYYSISINAYLAAGKGRWMSG